MTRDERRWAFQSGQGSKDEASKDGNFWRWDFWLRSSEDEAAKVEDREDETAKHEASEEEAPDDSAKDERSRKFLERFENFLFTVEGSIRAFVKYLEIQRSLSATVLLFPVFIGICFLEDLLLLWTDEKIGGEVALKVSRNKSSFTQTHTQTTQVERT